MCTLRLNTGTSLALIFEQNKQCLVLTQWLLNYAMKKYSIEVLNRYINLAAPRAPIREQQSCSSNHEPHLSKSYILDKLFKDNNFYGFRNK